MVNVNGELLDSSSNFINHFNRGFRFGDSLYEEVRVLQGKPVFWEEHYFRLMANMRILRMEIPMEFTMEFLEAEILKLIDSQNLLDKNVLVRMSVFRTLGHSISPAGNQITYVLDAQEINHPFYILPQETYEVELFKDYFVNSDMLSNLNTNNEMLKVVASVYAKENGYADCLLLNGNKHVVEAIRGNVFLVKDNHVKTPKLSEGASNRVLRKKIIELIQTTEGYEIEEETISPFELQKADEFFVSNISDGIIPITKYRKKTYENTLAQKLIGKLNANSRLANLK